MLHKYPAELKTRALCLLTDRLDNNPNQSTYTACRDIGERLGIGPETLRTASAFCSGTRPPSPIMIRYIDMRRDRFGG